MIKHGISAILTMCFLAILLFWFTATAQNAAPGEWEDGWVNADTYRFVSTGTDFGRNEIRACEAARVIAVRQAGEKLGRAGCDLAGGQVRCDVHGNAIAGEINAWIKTGNPVRRKFSAATKSCKIVYEVSEPGLKEKIIKTVEKYRSR